MSASTRRPALIALAVAMVVGSAVVFVIRNGGGSSPAAGSASPPTSSSGVTRVRLGQANPTNAPGQVLYLEQVTIAPRTKLPEHFHQGTQVARVTTGVLTYNIISGTATITRGDGRTEEASGPKEVRLAAGETVLETRGLVHFGANDTDGPVVIELAALLDQGAPLATSVGTGATGTAMHLTAALESQARTLFTAGSDDSVVYGWNRLTATTTLDGQPVGVDMLGDVTYTAGRGPISGFITFSFSDGSTLGVTMNGAAQASAGSADAAFAATLGVVGGTGRYTTAKGTGTFVGSRTAALGGTVSATFDLRVDGAR